MMMKQSYPSGRCIPQSHPKKIKYRLANEQSLKKQKNASSADLLRGSISLEAALVLPICLLLFTAFLSFFSLISFQVSLQNAMNRVCQKVAASYYAVYESGEGQEEENEISKQLLVSSAVNLLSTGGIQKLVTDELGELDDQIIKGGIKGLSFLGSGYQPLDDSITIQAHYKMKLPGLPGLSLQRTFFQSVSEKAWVGKSLSAENEEEKVYITENGTVYHTSLNCTYLALSIRQVSYDQLSSLRNESGEKYKACSICAKTVMKQVYITSYGDCYHTTKSCSGLKRGILSIPLSEVESRTLCTRCRERETE